MDFWGWIEFLWKLLQPAAVIAMAVVLFLWHKNYREAKNAVIELKEERLKEKDEQLRSKDEQLKAKDEQIKGVEKKNEVLELLSAEMLQKNYSAMKKMFEDQIAHLEIEKEKFKERYKKAESDLIESEASGGRKAEEFDSLKQEIHYLKEQLKQTEIGISAIQGSQHKFHEMRVKDAYGPIGAWFLLFKSRATRAFRGEYTVESKTDLDSLVDRGKAMPIPENLRNYLGMLDEFEGLRPIYTRTEAGIASLAAKYKDDPEAFKKQMKELESQAWEDFFDMTISQAIRWAGSNIQGSQNDKDHGDKNGEG